MLVYERKAGQTVMIGHDIIITVLEIIGNQVRLQIVSPSKTDDFPAKRNEKHDLGSGIFITVTNIGANHVKLGFDAPYSIRILLLETYEKINGSIEAQTLA